MWTVTPCDATPPSCADLPPTCGPNGDSDCCESDLVPGGDFFRQVRYSPATVHPYCLDKYEVSVGRMRRFLADYPNGIPVAGAGKNPYNADDPGWDEAWTARLPPTQETLATKLNASSCSPKTWRTTAPDNDEFPANCLDWYMAYAFCAWDGGWLPTRVEWKFAAFAGNEQRIFPWSVPPDNRQHDTTQATFKCDTCDAADLTPVGAKPLGNGLYGQSDLAGNVMEWVQDWHTYDYPEPCADCADLTNGTDRELLGGSATSLDSYLAQASTYYPPTQTWGYIGFRCARAQ
jgi:formylglycine-generating enzyme required for sulfatase activity